MVPTSVTEVSLDLAPWQQLQPLLDAANRGVRVRIVGNDGGINTDALGKLKDAGAEIVMWSPVEFRQTLRT